MTDTHCHPYLEDFEDGGREAVARALEAGVNRLVLPNVDASTVDRMKHLHETYPENTSMAMGLHPTEVGDGWENIVDDMEAELRSGGYVAIGEVGIDLYWDNTRKKEQMEAFSRQLRIAAGLNLPVIIHCREGLDETLECIREVSPRVPLIFHSFTGSKEDVEKIREVCDPMFGINGVVTYKSAQPLRDALQEIGLSHILLETDSPYLTPVPHRGKRNEPANVVLTCRKVAEVLGVDPEEVARQTDANAENTFHL